MIKVLWWRTEKQSQSLGSCQEMVASLEGNWTVQWRNHGPHKPFRSCTHVQRCLLLNMTQFCLYHIISYLPVSEELWIIPTKISTRWVGPSTWSGKSQDRLQPRPTAPLPKIWWVSELERLMRASAGPQPDPKEQYGQRKICPSTHKRGGRYPVVSS